MNFLTADVAIKVDDKQLPAQLAKAKTAVTRTVDKIKSSFSKMASSFKAAWDKIGRYAKIAGAVVIGAYLLMARAAMKQEDAQFLLAASLKISGEYTKALESKFRKFASELQRVTIYGDEFILSLMQQQKSLGVSADKLEEAAKQSIGLATATGRDISSMAMYVALAQQGEFTMLRRYIPALRSTTDETKQLAIITEFAAKGFELAIERAKTTSGALIQMKNALGDAAEKMGAALLPTIKDFGHSLTTVVQEGGAFQKFIQDQVEGLTAMIEAMEWLDKKRKEMARPILPILPTPVLPPKEWYMQHPEKIGEGIKTMEEAGRIAPVWMYAYKKRAEEAEALMKATTEYYNIQVQQWEEEKKISVENVSVMAEHRKKMLEQGGTLEEMEYRNSLDRINALMEEEKRMKQTVMDVAQEQVNFVRQQDYMTREERIQNLEAYVEANANALEQVKEANQILADEIDKLEEEKFAAIKRWATRAADWFKNLGDILVNAFDRVSESIADVLMGAEMDWKALGRAVIREVLAMIVRLQMLFLWQTLTGTAGLFGGGAPAGISTTATRPSTVGTTLVPTGQHGGLVTQTGLAKIHKGEVFSGVNNEQGFGNTIVNISDYAGVDIEVDEYIQSDQRIIDVSLSAAAGDGTYRRAHRIG